MNYPEQVNEGIIEMVHSYTEAVKSKNFESIWGLIHSEDKSRLFGIYFGKESDKVYGDFVEDWIMEMFEGNSDFDIDDYQGLGTNVKVNEFGTKYVVLRETERIGEVWNEPTQTHGVPISFKEEYVDGKLEYKIKLYSDDFPNDFNLIYE